MKPPRAPLPAQRATIAQGVFRDVHAAKPSKPGCHKLQCAATAKTVGVQTPQNPQKNSALDFPGRFVLRVSEVAKVLSITERHVIDLIEEGKLRAINVAGNTTTGRKFYRIPVEAYLAYLRAQTV
jgi:excisionase family DNA binding protein